MIVISFLKDNFQKGNWDMFVFFYLPFMYKHRFTHACLLIRFIDSWICFKGERCGLWMWTVSSRTVLIDHIMHTHVQKLHLGLSDTCNLHVSGGRQIYYVCWFPLGIKNIVYLANFQIIYNQINQWGFINKIVVIIRHSKSSNGL